MPPSGDNDIVSQFAETTKFNKSNVNKVYNSLDEVPMDCLVLDGIVYTMNGFDHPGGGNSMN